MASCVGIGLEEVVQAELRLHLSKHVYKVVRQSFLVRQCAFKAETSLVCYHLSLCLRRQSAIIMQVYLLIVVSSLIDEVNFTSRLPRVQFDHFIRSYAHRQSCFREESLDITLLVVIVNEVHIACL